MRLFPLISEAGEQHSRMVSNAVSRVVHGKVGVVAESHYSSIGKLLGGEIPQPKAAVLGPSVETVAIQAMHHDNIA